MLLLLLLFSASARIMSTDELSLNDAVMPKCYTRVLFMYEYIIHDLENDFIEFLKQFCPNAFDQIVYDENKPNSGRLIRSELDPNRVFTRAEQKDQSISYYINCSYQQLDVFPYSPIPTDTSPLVFLHQITLLDGTLLIFGVHHHLSDGHGFFTLFNRFANWTREHDASKIPPFNFDRSLLKPADRVSYEHIEYTTIPPNFSFTELPSMDVIIKRYTKQELFDKLKISNRNLSFNDVLVAWLTQSISRIRRIPANERVNIGMASNGREQLGLDSNYFGNCNFYICLQFQMKDLLDKSVNDLAEEINREKKQRMSREYMTSALALVQNAQSTIHPGFQSFLSNDLAFTNWSRFPAFQIDFGQGPPRRISLPPGRWDGLILILPTETDQVEIYIGLKEDHAKEFLKTN